MSSRPRFQIAAPGRPDPINWADGSKYGSDFGPMQAH